IVNMTNATFRRGGWTASAALLFVTAVAAPAFSAAAHPAPNAAARASTPSARDPPIGQDLSGRPAQQVRDYPAPAGLFEKAIARHPQAPELISRSFVMEVSVGHFDRARRLADDELKIDPTDALADLVLLVDRLKAGDTAGAVRYAAALPSDGVHRFVGPLALAWTRMAAGDLAGADNALQGLDKFNGFQMLKSFQLGLLYDFAGKPDKAEEFYTKTLGEGDQLNWRLADVIANFYERHGQADKAQALYQRFMQQNTVSELAQSV